MQNVYEFMRIIKAIWRSVRKERNTL